MKSLMMWLLSRKENRSNLLRFPLMMMTTGSLIKISSLSYMMLTPMSNSKDRIPEPELLLLMMINQDIFTSRKQKRFQHLHQREKYKLLLKEEMEVMVLLRLTLLRLNWMIRHTLPLLELILNLSS